MKNKRLSNYIYSVAIYNAKFLYCLSKTQHFHLTYVVPIIVVFRVVDSQSRSLRFKTDGWLQGQLILLSFRGWLNENQELLQTQWWKVNCLLIQICSLETIEPHL